MVMKMKYYGTALIFVMTSIFIITGTGCKKLVEADFPIDKITAKAVFSSSGTASAALSNIYYLLSYEVAVAGRGGPSVMNGLTADELILQDSSDPFLQSLYSNSLSPDGFDAKAYWNTCYDLIFRINSIIVGVQSSTGISASAKNQLIGQAKFLRAYVYFYLVNEYGGVPLVLSTDYKVNTSLPRSDAAKVYDQIIADLTEAQTLLGDSYLKPDLITATTERTTANKAVATALLARVYLYTQQWQKAEEEATKVIINPAYSINIPLDQVFLMNSEEAIWQVEGDVTVGTNTPDGDFFIPAIAGQAPRVYLSNGLMNTFSSGDNRRRDWIDSSVVGNEIFYYPFKYKKRAIDPSTSMTTEYDMMLRLGEQYLIRAEARAHSNDINGATADINMIRARAGLSAISPADQASLLIAIEKERRVELFTESGHRWFDLKRTNRADAILAPIKGNDWQSTDQLFPIPASEFLLDPGLRGHQNPGYSEE
jgi:hypothetical protein